MKQNNEIRRICTRIYELDKNDSKELDIYLNSLSDDTLLTIMKDLCSVGIPEEHVVLFNVIYPELLSRGIDFIKKLLINDKGDFYDEFNIIPDLAKLFLILDDSEKLAEAIKNFSDNELYLIAFDLLECNLFISTNKDARKSMKLSRLVHKEIRKRKEEAFLAIEKKLNL